MGIHDDIVHIFHSTDVAGGVQYIMTYEGKGIVCGLICLAIILCG